MFLGSCFSKANTPALGGGKKKANGGLQSKNQTRFRSVVVGIFFFVPSVFVPPASPADGHALRAKKRKARSLRRYATVAVAVAVVFVIIGAVWPLPPAHAARLY